MFKLNRQSLNPNKFRQTFIHPLKHHQFLNKILQPLNLNKLKILMDSKKMVLKKYKNKIILIHKLLKFNKLNKPPRPQQLK